MGSFEMVTLRGGLVVHLNALRLLLDLEARGFSVHQADNRLHVQPSTSLTADDVAGIRQHRDALLALVRTCEAVQ